MKFNTNNKEIPFSYIGSNFEKWFGDMDFPTIADMEPLESKKLPRRMNDVAILEELQPQEVTLGEVYKTLETMSHDVWALFYVKDKDDVLRAVLVYWSDGGWFVNAYEVSYPSEWYVGFQVFSRNFGIGTSETLSLGNLDTRLKRLEKLFNLE